MDPWSKVHYSRHIRKASMEMKGLPEVNPPSDWVPGQRLPSALILKRQRRNREEIGKSASGGKGYGIRVSSAEVKIGAKGATRGGPSRPGGLWARPTPRPHREGISVTGGPPPDLLR